MTFFTFGRPTFLLNVTPFAVIVKNLLSFWRSLAIVASVAGGKLTLMVTGGAVGNSILV